MTTNATISKKTSAPKHALLQSAQDLEQQLLSGKRDRGEDLQSAVGIFLEFLQGYEFFGDPRTSS